MMTTFRDVSWRQPVMLLAASCVLLSLPSCEHLGGSERAATDSPPVSAQAAPAPAKGGRVKSAKAVSRRKPLGSPATAADTPAVQPPLSLLLPDERVQPLCTRQAEPRPVTFVKWLEERDPAATNPQGGIMLTALPPRNPVRKTATPPRNRGAVNANRATDGAPVVSAMVYVVTESLNVRGAPDTKAPVIGVLKKGSAFRVTMSNGWARLGDGQFAMAKYLSTKPPLADVKQRPNGRRLAAR